MATGGAGVNFASGSITSGANTVTGGGGSLSASANNNVTAGTGSFNGLTYSSTATPLTTTVGLFLSANNPLIYTVLSVTGAGSDASSGGAQAVANYSQPGGGVGGPLS